MRLSEALDADLIGFDGLGNVTLPREAFEAVHAAAREFNQNADSVDSVGVSSSGVELARLREDIENAWERCLIREQRQEPEIVAVFAAARRFLALTETGPDYEAAAARIIKEYPNLPKAEREVVVFAKAVVDAALADYLTEEDR